MEENTVRTFVYRIISTVLAKENARGSHGKKNGQACFGLTTFNGLCNCGKE